VNTSMSRQQRGLSLEGFIFIAFLFVCFGIMGLKLIPPYMQAASIKKLFISLVHEPDLQKALPHDIKVAFDRQASIDNVTAIKGDDIDISTEDGRLILSASYDVKVPLVANASLLLSFNPSSEGK
jgi:hypothetical protein